MRKIISTNNSKEIDYAATKKRIGFFITFRYLLFRNNLHAHTTFHYYYSNYNSCRKKSYSATHAYFIYKET